MGIALALAAALLLVLDGTLEPHGSAEPLEARINPNVAPVASLARLPGVGLGRAQAIVQYREDLCRRTGVTVAFRSLGDLQRVSGIGPKTAEGLADWLRFD